MANSTTVTADGVQTDFSVTFPFLDRAHVKVRLSGVLQSPPAYSWITASSIRFASAPAYGALVLISRETPLTPVTDFSDGATLDANSLDRAIRQPLYLVEDLETGDTSIEAAAILADAYAYTNTREVAIRADFPTGGGGGPGAAADVSLVDAGGYFTGTTVEAALQEVGAADDSIRTPSYLVLANTANLDNERRLVAGTNVTIVDGGPGGDLTISAAGGGGGGSTANAVTISDSGGFYAAGNVEDALQEVWGAKAASSHTHTFASLISTPTTVAGYGITDLAASAGASLVGFTRTGTGAAARTVQDRLRDFISVKDYGAVGNGVADDRTAIVNADAAAFAAGKALFFPAGTYMVSAHIYGLKASWYGEQGSMVKATAGLTLNLEAMLTWTSVDDITIRDMAFDLQSRPVTAGSEAVVNLTNCGGFEIANCRVLNLTGVGLAINGGRRFRVVGNFISKATPAITQNQAILISSSSRSSLDGYIESNYLFNSAMNVACVDLWVVGNYITGWGFGAGVTTEQDVANSIRVRIINNVLENSQSTVDVNGYRPGGVENWAPYSVIAGNHIAACAGAGIDQGGKYTVVRDNVILNNGTSGVDSTPGPQSSGGDGINSRYGSVTFNGSYSTICNNTILDQRAAGDKLQGWGYADQSASIVGIHLYGNRYDGNFLGDENILGTAGWYSRPVTSGNFKVSTTGGGNFEFTCPVTFGSTVTFGGSITAGLDLIVSSGNRVRLQGAGSLTGFRYSSGVVEVISGASFAAGFSDTKVGFCGTTPVTKPNITGSRAGNAALASLLTQLASMGLITDGTTA
jgi:hypothetical protein